MLKPYYVLLTDSQYIMGGLRMVICPCLIGVVRTEVGEGTDYHMLYNYTARRLLMKLQNSGILKWYHFRQ